MVKDEVISSVLVRMESRLDREQLAELRTTLVMEMQDIDLIRKSREIVVAEDMDLNEKYLQKYAVEKKVENLADSTIRGYIRENRRFLNETGKRFTDVTKDDVMVYLAKMSQKGLSLNYVDNARKYIKSFFDWLCWNDYIAKNPLERLKCTRRDAVKKVILTDGELEEMRDACHSKRELAILDFLASTGVRVSELIGLTINDVNWVQGTVHVYAPKTRTHRQVMLDAKALKHLIDYRSELSRQGINDVPLFLNTRRGSDGHYHALSKKSAEQILHNITERTKIEKVVTVHVIRKTYASRLYRKGVKPAVIQYVLGHAEFSTTAKYYIGLEEIDIQSELRAAA